MNIVMIGAGNVATHLTQALHQAGEHILQVYSRTEQSAAALAQAIGCPYTCCTEELDPRGDLYIVSVKDDALPHLLPEVAQANPEALFVHTAGSVPMNIWETHVRRYGVIYPMQTFSKQRDIDFREVSFFIEASAQADEVQLMQLARRLSPKVYRATSEQRKYLHIAAVFACNFANHMYAISSRLLTEHGLPFDAMLPLIDETARKVHRLPPSEAQTGPAQRNDVSIMASHLQMLEDTPQLQELYKKISKNIHQYNTELP